MDGMRYAGGRAVWWVHALQDEIPWRLGIYRDELCGMVAARGRTQNWAIDWPAIPQDNRQDGEITAWIFNNITKCIAAPGIYLINI